MTREELLSDPYVKDNFGDKNYPNYIEPNFEAGVDYAEDKIINKACKWLKLNIPKYTTIRTSGCYGENLERKIIITDKGIEEFIKAMTE
ncbi:MAG: hypothetical protein IKT40_12440 [Bacilli bacterium]|nr:hypothetical protein [Bacilli bacterium]